MSTGIKEDRYLSMCAGHDGRIMIRQRHDEGGTKTEFWTEDGAQITGDDEKALLDFISKGITEVSKTASPT